jgi:hypothetical protein
MQDQCRIINFLRRAVLVPQAEILRGVHPEQSRRAQDKPAGWCVTSVNKVNGRVERLALLFFCPAIQLCYGIVPSWMSP